MRTLTRMERAGAFCRGLIRGSPLVEVSSAALEKGAEGEERLRHIDRIASGGSCEQIGRVLSEIHYTSHYRGFPSIPADLQVKLAEGYARASAARTGQGSAASAPFVLTALASTAVVTVGLFSGGAVPLLAMGVGIASAAAAKKIPESFERKASEERAGARRLARLPLCESARAALEGLGGERV